jgi:hypothetical protein
MSAISLPTGQKFFIGSMKGLTQSQYLLYSKATSVFYRVHAYDLDVYVQRLNGNRNNTYYIFVDNNEQMMYKLGQRILFQNDPVGALRFDDYTGVGGRQVFLYQDVFKI